VCFIVPVDIAGPAVTVVFTTAAGIKNPCTAGTYNLYVNTSRAPDLTPVKSADYVIAPAVSTYAFVWDSNPTYPGLAVGFVPPFKMCGQNTTTALYDPTLAGGAGGFLNAFNLTFMATVVGCLAPCENVTLSLNMTKAPAGSTVTLNISGTVYKLTPAAPNVTGFATITDLEVDESDTWASYIHFDTLGDYTICFYTVCPTAPICLPPGSETITTTCFNFKVYQWKDAYEIPLYRKWNLISLPLVPFDTNITNILAALPANLRVQITAIWNYDPAAAVKWANWPSPGLLTTMVDGKSYWVRTVYNSTNPMGQLIGNLWVWGTAKPVPPNSPSAYPVSAGWNMVGFTEIAPLAPMLPATYLWGLTVGAVYGWNAVTQTWVASPTPLNSGVGYWAAFGGTGGTIYPP
jgi:hypothetical protein